MFLLWKFFHLFSSMVQMSPLCTIIHLQPQKKQAVLATNNVNVLDSPVNSPDLNPMAQVWDELGRHVQRNAIHIVNNLAAALQAGWANLALRLQHTQPYHSLHCTKWWTHEILTHFIESSVFFC